MQNIDWYCFGILVYSCEFETTELPNLQWDSNLCLDNKIFLTHAAATVADKKKEKRKIVPPIKPSSGKDSGVRYVFGGQSIVTITIQSTLTVGYRITINFMSFPIHKDAR